MQMKLRYRSEHDPEGPPEPEAGDTYIVYGTLAGIVVGTTVGAIIGNEYFNIIGGAIVGFIAGGITGAITGSAIKKWRNSKSKGRQDK
jgi:outer membrane lipoprotein SlyB